MKMNYDSDFSPNSVDDNIKIVDPRQQIKKRKALLKIKDVSTKHSGLWSNQENQIYMGFLAENKCDFQEQYLRRSRKVFNRLSKLLPNRTSQQCRSHHQKLQLRSNSECPDAIIKYVSSRILKKKQRGSTIKTKPDEYNKLQELGFVITQGPYKEIKIILSEPLLGFW